MQPLLAAPREAYTEAEVESALYSASPKVRHGVDVLDTADEETDETIDVIDGDVTWSYRPPDRVTGDSTDVAAVRRQASLNVNGSTAVPLALRRYRIWTEMLSSSGNWIRFWLGVFVATNPPLQDDGLRLLAPLRLADKSYRYANRFLDETLTIAAATVCVDWVISDLGTRFGETTFAIPTSTVTLSTAKQFEVGTPLLAVYNAILETAGYDQLTTDETGRPTSTPLDALAGRGPEITYGPRDDTANPPKRRIVTVGAVEPLLPTLPNVVRFVARNGPTLAEEGNGITTVRNQSTGPSSIDEVGEEVVLVIQVEAENQTQLADIAAADAQRYFAGGGHRFTGRIGLNPRHSDRDVVTLDKPRLGLTGTWLVTQWTYPLRPIESEDDVLMPVTFERRVA